MARTRLEDIQVSEDWTGFSQKDLVKTLSELQDKTISDLRVLQDAQGRLAKHAARSLSINKELKRRTKLRTAGALEAVEAVKKPEKPEKKAEKPVSGVKRSDSSDSKPAPPSPELRRSKRRKLPESETESEGEKDSRRKSKTSNSDKKEVTVDLTSPAERALSDTSEKVRELLEKDEAKLKQELQEVAQCEEKIIEDLHKSVLPAISKSVEAEPTVKKISPLPVVADAVPVPSSEEIKIREQQEAQHSNFLSKEQSLKVAAFLVLIDRYSGPDGPTKEGFAEACAEYPGLKAFLNPSAGTEAKVPA